MDVSPPPDAAQNMPDTLKAALKKHPDRLGVYVTIKVRLLSAAY